MELVYVSNHGGRQLDHGRGSLEVLLTSPVPREHLIYGKIAAGTGRIDERNDPPAGRGLLLGG